MIQPKDIPGFEGRYQINSDGVITSIARVVYGRNGGAYIKPSRTLRKEISRHGYFRIGLSINGVQKKYLVSRLVLSTFAPRADSSQLQANHLNGITNDDRLENLEWCTVSENNLHAYAVLGRKTQAYWTGKGGAGHPKAKTAIGRNENGLEVVRFTPIAQAHLHGFSASKISASYARKHRHKGLYWEVKD